MGHTPFGHSGEEALRKLMAGHGGFEHNSHSLRIVDKLEHRYPNFPGLNLTYEVRESIAKHTTRHDNPPPAGFDDSQQPLLEGQVVDAADEIAYDNHDVEDGLRANIITPEELGDLDLGREAAGRAKEAFKHLDTHVEPTQIITFLIHILTIDLLENTAEQIRGAGADSSEAVRAAGRRLVGFSPAMQAKKKKLEDFLIEKVYRHYRVQRMANKAKRFVIGLFEEYVREPNQLPPRHQALIGEEAAGELGAEDAPYRVVCDYVAGMTDRFAQEEYKRLFYPFERV